MLNHLSLHRLVVIVILCITLVFLVTAQSNPPFFFLFPMLLLILLISWYLYHAIQQEHEEQLKQSIHNMQTEQEAQHWLHKSFVPKIRSLDRKNIRIIIAISGLLLLSFLFLWSYFVSGLLAAALNTLIGCLFFVGFIIYALYMPKEFTHLFKHVPARYRHHSKNSWVHAYLLLLPLALLGFFLYSLTTTGEGIIGSISTTGIFFFSYTFIFICLYCLWYLYEEYQKEMEQSLKKEAKKNLKRQ